MYYIFFGYKRYDRVGMLHGSHELPSFDTVSVVNVSKYVRRIGLFSKKNYIYVLIFLFRCLLSVFFSICHCLSVL